MYVSFCVMCPGCLKRVVSANEPDFSSDTFQLLTSSVMHLSARFCWSSLYSRRRGSHAAAHPAGGGRITSASKDILRRRVAVDWGGHSCIASPSPPPRGPRVCWLHLSISVTRVSVQCSPLIGLLVPQIMFQFE